MSYRIRSWSEYNAGLKQRGSLTFWLDDTAFSEWVAKEKSGKRGASKTYSDVAIATFETIKAVYRQAGRQTEGLLVSLFDLMGIALSVLRPQHRTSTQRRFESEITCGLAYWCGISRVDSTGIKVYGEGEWKRRGVAPLCGARECAPRQKIIRYHRRSLAATTMFRHKAVFGGKIRSRKFDNQVAEILLQCAALNRMIQLAKPDAVWVDD
ncbi:MAG: hypothetical protein DCF15_15745 [Phormidesmis priestleyi]|uniref:Transposase DDE domain-containing protein n=1 Tax=Phormidesmis priestleyi TaxID=268141 RepID=A0A2W4WZJ6_9CYAN|nr:MAG: hypothetical protein DCF15_15745 [Phormidesmis priestleyi]